MVTRRWRANDRFHKIARVPCDRSVCMPAGNRLRNVRTRGRILKVVAPAAQTGAALDAHERPLKLPPGAPFTPLPSLLLPPPLRLFVLVFPLLSLFRTCRWIIVKNSFGNLSSLRIAKDEVGASQLI